MLRLHFNVTEERVKLDAAQENDTPAAGNINYIECSFNLPEAYDDLIVEAVFNGERRALVDGVCTAPHIESGECTVGVIAYELENDSYKQLSSPRPCTICLPKGSFDNTGKESEQPSPGALEDYYQRIKKLITAAGGRNPDNKLKDIIVVRSFEEYDALFGDEEYVTNLTESLQEGEYIFLVVLESDMGDGNLTTILTTLGKENDELVFYDGFSTDIIRQKIKDAVLPISKELEAIKPIIDNKQDRAFELKHNCEHRRPETELLSSTWLQLSLPSAIPDDYISSLVFNSGNEPTTLSYPQTIIFTGDDCIDNVFVPKANTTYNVMFWYDGINVNAVSRGVPYAQE
jgi:hypothetical protein|nr:MAG TPA: hypothetical protein [Caudoviricetes sp.]